MAGQLSWFIRVSNIPERDERDFSYPIHRYRKEMKRLYGVLERQLADQAYICGDYSIADIACWTWVDQYRTQVSSPDDYPNIATWHARIATRPAVQRGANVWHPESNEGWSAAGNAAQMDRYEGGESE